MNCHKKCEKLTANLCGVNQKLIVEALSSVRRGIIDFIIIGQWEKNQEIKFLKKSSLSSGDAWSLTDNLSFSSDLKIPDSRAEFYSSSLNLWHSKLSTELINTLRI